MRGVAEVAFGIVDAARVEEVADWFARRRLRHFCFCKGG